MRITRKPAAVLTLAVALAWGCGGDKKDAAGDTPGGDTPGGNTQPATGDCTTPVCGDGLVCPDAGEVCDDGATADGDGCSASCQYETTTNDWIAIPGATDGSTDGSGTFAMGSDSGYSNETPVHDVTVTSFEILKSEVTVTEFKACVDAGTCTAPGASSNALCNWGALGRANHPMNCVPWAQADTYCKWVDPAGRLPTEAEWEYAARGGGAQVAFPWGDTDATCDVAVLSGTDGSGCGRGVTWPACAKPNGNTTQGLCDMAGNVNEWVEDTSHNGYDGAPTDGSAWVDSGSLERITRGGAWSNAAYELQTTRRNGQNATNEAASVGFRCAR